jgi:hypothetical protein
MHCSLLFSAFGAAMQCQPTATNWVFGWQSIFTSQ